MPAGAWVDDREPGGAQQDLCAGARARSSHGALTVGTSMPHRADHRPARRVELVANAGLPDQSRDPAHARDPSPGRVFYR